MLIIFLSKNAVLRIWIRRIRMLLGLLHPNPYPLVRVMDPRIRIHTKILWIRNAEKMYVLITVAVQAIKLSEACDHYLWNFKREVTQKARFLEQATKICAGDIDKLRVCEARRYIYRQNRV